MDTCCAVLWSGRSTACGWSCAAPGCSRLRLKATRTAHRRLARPGERHLACTADSLGQARREAPRLPLSHLCSGLCMRPLRLLLPSVPSAGQYLQLLHNLFTLVVQPLDAPCQAVYRQSTSSTAVHVRSVQSDSAVHADTYLHSLNC